MGQLDVELSVQGLRVPNLEAPLASPSSVAPLASPFLRH